jgi:hypothetical protein
MIWAIVEFNAPTPAPAVTSVPGCATARKIATSGTPRHFAALRNLVATGHSGQRVGRAAPCNCNHGFLAPDILNKCGRAAV